ncbi:FAST kinase domain-containing protein 2, mitochondrial isoform X2 [Syngnathoides biaculeatus]|uniref:FAST kinase domain-containing protein 2, mitochondrial isoform X2 n=1 Tax=Syngnathoides biaculeatus TaxID=300417 RepID=UPI002ADDF8ED|nr:FAST kinase domain-containing protein 2, mitochondrial isoform X2 [Syngnathoides biaculeatus]
MSLRVAQELMRRSLRSCIYTVKHCSSTVTDSDMNSSCSSKQQLVHIYGTRQIQPWRVTTCNSSVRYHSQDSSLGPEKTELVYTAVAGSLVLEEVQSPSGQKQWRSPFFEHLQLCGSPSDVLDLSQQYKPSPRHISKCLTHMWGSIKNMSDVQRRCELQLMFEHPEFDQLLQVAMTAVGSMWNEDLAYCLLAMVNLGVPQRSRVVQMYLRACQEMLNDFDEKSLSILASCLEQMKNMPNVPNVDALKQGLRLVVEGRLPRIKNVLGLQTAMRLLGKDMSLEVKWKLEQKALSMTEQFTLPNTQYMISTMAMMGFYSKSLLDICSQRITENLHEIPFNRLLAVLLSCRELNYKNFTLLTSICDYLASTLDIWTQKEVVLLLSVFESLAFCPAALMGDFSKKIIANPGTLSLKDLLCVLKVYSSLNYCLQHDREQFLQSLSQSLNFYLPRMSEYELLKACYCMCLLGHFPSMPLEKLLQGSTLEVLSSRVKYPRKQEQMFQTVHLCLHLDQHFLPRPLSVPAHMQGVVRCSAPPANQRFLQLLQRTLSDQADIVLEEMVVVENLYFIDAVISKFVAKQPSSEETQAQKWAVLCLAPSAFCFGTSQLRGPLAVKLRHLKILGYHPIMITQQDLRSEERQHNSSQHKFFWKGQPQA